MELLAASTALKLTRVQSKVNYEVLNKAMNAQKGQISSLVQMIDPDAAAVQRSVNPDVGRYFDQSI